MKVKIIYIILILLLGLLPFIWTRDNHLINGGDINFGLDPVKEFGDRLYAWNPYYNGGVDNCINFGSLPYLAVKVVCYLFTGSLIWTQKLIFVFWYLLIVIAIFLLVNEIFPRGWITARIAAVVFYSINLYQLSIWRSVNIAAIVSLAAIPLLLLFLIKILLHRKKVYFLPFALVSLLWGVTSINPPVMILTFVFLLVFVCYLICIAEKRLPALRQGIMALVLLIVINSYCLLPVVYRQITNKENKETTINRYNARHYLITQSKCSSFNNVVRLMGNSEFYFKWQGDPYYPSFQHFRENKYSYLGYLLPFLALLGFLIYRKESYVKFFFLITLISIMLSMGLHPPMRKVYAWLYNRLPLFWLYRSPWLKFSFFTVLGYSLLAGLGVEVIFRLLRRRIVAVFSVACLLVIYIQFMSPFVLGEMFTGADDHAVLKPTRLVVPEYIFEFADWMNKQKGDGNILFLPDAKVNIYNWGYMGLTDLSEMLVNKGVVNREYGERGQNPALDDVYKLIVKKIYQGEDEGVDSLLSNARVQFICQRNDFQYGFYGGQDSPQFIKDALNKQQQITYLRSFGAWDVYQVDGSSAPLLGIVSGYKEYPLSYKQRNPVWYNTDIKGYLYSENSELVFRQNYDYDWLVFLQPETTKKWHILNSHRQVQSYANGWGLQDWLQTDLRVEIVYFPQLLFYLGLIISIIGLIMTGVFSIKATGSAMRSRDIW